MEKIHDDAALDWKNPTFLQVFEPHVCRGTNSRRLDLRFYKGLLVDSR